MQTMLIRERYKVTRSLATGEEYAFLECVDIRDREKKACHLNLYEGSCLPVYLDIYDRLGDQPGFREMFIADGTLVGVFDAVDGPNIDQVFYRGAEVSWQDRMEFAELLLHKALTLSELPAEVSCAAMLSENLIVDLNGHRVRTCWRILPMEGMNARELTCLTIDQLHKILLKRFVSPLPELEFMQLLDDGACRSVVQLYSMWREWKGSICEAYQTLESKNAIKRWIAHLRKHIKWAWISRKKGRIK